VALGSQRFGTHRVRWDGRDEQGRLLAPGLYLIEVAPESEQVGTRLLRTIGIVY
jgi:hypothetical protein